MRIVLSLVTLAVLAACGVDGAPLRPGTKEPITPTSPGVRVTGEAHMGMVTKL